MMGTPSQASVVRTQTIQRPRPSLKTGVVDYQKTWGDLREDIRCVLLNHTQPAPQPQMPIERQHHEVYKVCTSACTALPQGVEQMKPAPHLLYQHLKDFLTQHVNTYVVKQVQGHQGDQILRSYLREWAGFSRGIDWVHAAFKYLNQDWVTKECGKARQDILEVRSLGYACWRDNLYRRVSGALITALLDAIEADRRGAPADHATLRGVVQSIVALGDPRKSAFAFYIQEFETRFLKATEMFYKKEVADLLGRDGEEEKLPEYMYHVEKRLDEETRRLHQYLNTSTDRGLKRMVVKVTIDDHITTLLEASRTWFDQDRQQEQRRLFRLLSRSEGGLEPLRKLIEDRIDTDGKAALEQQRAEALRDPCVYVETILKVHSKYAEMVSNIFDGHDHFRAALDKGCKRFINRNCLSSATGASKSAELLAKYTHLLLRPSRAARSRVRSDDELDRTLDQMLTIFKLLEDKDVFQKFYQTHLSRRLIQGMYVKDQEELMISKLKEVCGYEYTYKLQRMFQDMELSADVSAAYARQRDSSCQFPELHANVLTSGSWLLADNHSSAFQPPEMLCRALESFAQFYRQQHNGRKLTWFHWHSNGFVKTNYPLPKGRHYELQVNTFQLAVLFEFNQGPADEYPARGWAELQQATKMDDKDLDFALCVLCRHKILTAEGTPEGQLVGTMRGRTARLNSEFTSQSRKLALHAVQMREVVTQEDTATMKVVTEDRKYHIQAAIVRVMKARKTMAHALLIVEVVDQLKSKFSPSQHDIKRNIETLVEKEYMERTNDGKSYNYLA
eukprot:TRINITY_DN14852_c0_g1_i1.p1 TRINITY_DN14852_c0_g1~~TRINITY_DN14852_c0_g1_i1.p1  ORF type:complete len:789 (+),score=315.88 TRINITY_DN14852_c0_g1_i1:69-2435(+)